MKKTLLLLIALAGMLTAGNAAPSQPMLVQGKTWYYAYHHFEDLDKPGPDGKLYQESISYRSYTLKGDTVIDGRTYMKMYCSDSWSYGSKYFGAYREDDEGRVYMYDYQGDQQDFLLIDFTLQGYQEPGIDMQKYTVTEENFMHEGKRFHRYKYQAAAEANQPARLCAVEGVGFMGKGLVHYVFQPEVNGNRDYEELSLVEAPGFWFLASGFSAPKMIDLTDGERQLVTSSNDFAFRLFQLGRGKTSSVLSPLSITYALGMLNNAAAGQTQQEINQVLGFGEAGADAINAFCRKMLDEAGTVDEKTKALIANTIFVNEGLGYYLQDDFVAKVNAFYDAEPQARDFCDGETMDVINRWAADHTNQMIPQMLNEETFDSTAVSYLLNAIYFKGGWSSPFNVADTRDESFGGGPAVPVMHKKFEDMEYAENDLYQAIKLPYGNGAYAMTVYLPREDKDISEVLDALSGSNWQVKGRPYLVDVKLPRFESQKDLDLKPVMKALGMPKAFTPQEAEFPYFCNYSVYIGMMRQVARIKLDEQGTEAAAVTIIGTEASGMPLMADFHATRPFLYVISEQSTGAIFFIGQYTGGVTVSTPDAIHTPLSATHASPSAIHSLSGQRLSGKPAKCIYIQDGRKVVVTK